MNPFGFTDEQLSTILDAHCADQLRRWGAFQWKSNDGTTYPLACVNQAAYNEYQMAAGINYRAADWFDDNYQPAWTADQFLAAMARGAKKKRRAK